jgi:hypothetical protein
MNLSRDIKVFDFDVLLFKIETTAPTEWKSTPLLRDIAYLELIPIALAIFLWGQEFRNKSVIFFSVNEAVVSILNSKTSSH